MPTKYKYSKEIIEPIIKISYCWADVCRHLNIPPATGSQTLLAKRARVWNIDHSHFKGLSWNKGKKFGPKRKIEDYLSNKFWIGSHKLKLRLIQEGLKDDKCEDCGIKEWQGNQLPLELDHINGNHWDNTITNLKILCPNCHAVKTRKDRKN